MDSRRQEQKQARTDDNRRHPAIRGRSVSKAPGSCHIAPMLRHHVVLVLALGCTPGCGNKARQQGSVGDSAPTQAADARARELAAEVGFVSLDLAPANMAAMLWAPQQAAVTPRFLSARVTTPDARFALVVEARGGDIAGRKKAIEANDLNEFKRYVVDEPDAILYESSRDQRGEFHLLVYRSAGAKTFECQDEKGTSFTLQEAHTMLRACRSLAAR